ncbi:hypothetical protein [Spirochaeta africana]|uniref:Uncharacterized protein n=1 Tax=Spirochaeta africana (strain ATCC 700263 / DSM 8902 / Z-7692) TaxID=889378 RepID=H9ULA1_SPIAZ|nr:hypothetical protein [Spirochaeta africana]AFG38294.1 hypothetical protein Spiaf_2258 [Spirochaeta africana DSM 8902]
MQWKIGILMIALAIGVSGCSRIREASDAFRDASQYVDAARGMAQQMETMAGFQDPEDLPELTEQNVRNYYTQITKLQELHPDLDFENPSVAAMQAGMSGLNLQQIVTRNSDLSFEDYSGISTKLMILVAQSAAFGMSDELIGMMEQSVTSLEGVDDSDLSPEQREELQQELDQQRQAVAQAHTESSTPDMDAARRQIEMVMRIRQELGIQ